MKTYAIPVTFEMAGIITIKADSAEEAIRIANDHIDKLPLPDNKVYVDGSYEITAEDREIVEIYTKDLENKSLDVIPTPFIPDE